MCAAIDRPKISRSRKLVPIESRKTLVESRPFNPNKRKLCDTFVGNITYPVFEYDLNDLLEIEAMTKAGLNGAALMIAMLCRAMPTCPIDDLAQLTQSQAEEMVAMLQSTITLRGIQNLSSTSH